MSDGLLADVMQYRKRADIGSHMWSIGLYTFLGLPVVFGFVITLLSIDPASHKNALTALGAMSTAVSGIAAFGGFERKRIANRHARTALDILTMRMKYGNEDKAHLDALETILGDLDGAVTKVDKMDKGE